MLFVTTLLITTAFIMSFGIHKTISYVEKVEKKIREFY